MGSKASHARTLVIIGGREDRAGEMAILNEVAKRAGAGKLVIATVASTVGEELWKDYRAIFRKLGVKHISHLDVVNRKEAIDHRALKAVEGASAIFFTGGDQLKITSELGGTLAADEIYKIYERGGMIAGTSAGASVMSETMLVAGSSDSSYRIGSGVRTAPGLGFVKNMIIDQHFAERGRISRLIGVVAQNPRYLGIGIDENTAIIMDEHESFRVIGNGAVYVIDAHEATESNVADAKLDTALSIFNVRVHVLSAGDTFDMPTKTPCCIREEESAKPGPAAKKRPRPASKKSR
ncbi:MAG: cyanophycinase [Proteobacteria bacterium]|nr:MAG: cyanophycinase [Pseudomonadota bacterium]